MGLVRPLIVSVTILGFSTASMAGDLKDSIARASLEQTQPAAPKLDKAYMIPGAVLFVAGMSMALYGFLHTNGGDFVSGAVSKESNTALGAAGLGVAAAGGTVLFLGTRRAAHAPSITVGPNAVAITKRVAW
jgi:hypothetical protein